MAGEKVCCSFRQCKAKVQVLISTVREGNAKEAVSVPYLKRPSPHIYHSQLPVPQMLPTPALCLKGLRFNDSDKGVLPEKVS